MYEVLAQSFAYIHIETQSLNPECWQAIRILLAVSTNSPTPCSSIPIEQNQAFIPAVNRQALVASSPAIV